MTPLFGINITNTKQNQETQAMSSSSEAKNMSKSDSSTLQMSNTPSMVILGLLSFSTIQLFLPVINHHGIRIEAPTPVGPLDPKTKNIICTNAVKIVKDI